MALLESTHIELGSTMPDFMLDTADGASVSKDATMGKTGLLIKFTCNHCPYAIAVWERFIRLAEQAKHLGINTVAINPNIHPDYPQDSPENMVKMIQEYRIPFPYLVDKDQSIANAYQAQCTPDIYLLNHEGKLVYHGRIDDNWQDESAVQSQDLKVAIECLGNQKTIPEPQYPSMGCSIKWQ